MYVTLNKIKVACTYRLVKSYYKSLGNVSLVMISV